MRRFLPSNLPGQLALVMASALLVASLLNFVLLLGERHRAAVIEQSSAPIARFVDIAITVFSAPPPETARPFSVGRATGPGRYALHTDDPINTYSLPRDGGMEQRLTSALSDAGVRPQIIRASSRTVERPERGGRGNDRFDPDRPPPREQAEGPPSPGSPPSSAMREIREIVLSAQLPDGRWLSSFTLSPEPTRGDVFLLVASTIITFVFVLGAALWIARRLARPLHDLAMAAAHVGASGEPQQVVARGPGDVQQTIEAFNTMSRRVSQLLREKDVMLGALGHDLRTPLSSLRIRLETMEPESERLKAIRTIEEANDLLEDILELSRQGRSSEPERKTDISVIVEDMVEDYAETGVAVTARSIQRAVAPCRPVLLRRALRNLIDNAVTYGGNAILSVEQTASHVLIHIDDDGPGMSPDALTSATSPFYRGEASRNRSTGGAGLGLTLSEAIVRAHGGTLELANRTPNGLRATLRMPVSAA